MATPSSEDMKDEIEPGDEVTVTTSYGLFRGRVQRLVFAAREYVVV
jgi:hypothetical protein